VAALSISLPAKAGLHLHGGGGGVPLTNRKVQVGLNPDASTYKNLLLSAFISTDAASTNYPLSLNVDQYPTGVIPTNISYSFNLPSNYTTSTVFTIAWAGTVGLGADTGGGLSFGNGGSITIVSDPGSVVVGQTTSSVRMSGTNGIVQLKFNSVTPGATMVFASGANFGSGGTQFKNLFFGVGAFNYSQYTTIVSTSDPTQFLNPDYITAIKGLSPIAVRMLGFIGGVGFHTQHRYRLGWNTALSYSNTYWIPNCWAGVTRSGSNITNPAADGLTFIAAAATDTPVSYTAGEIIQGQFAVAGAVSGAPTLNVGSRGAKPIFNINGFAQDPSQLRSTQYATFAYDDILNGSTGCWIMIDPSNPGYGWTGSNTPLEMQAAVANAVGCHLWFQLCAHTTWQNSTMESSSNSVTQQLSALSSQLNNGCYLEYANEVWNFGAPFNTQWSWARQSAVAFGMGQDNLSFYGYKLATLMPIAKTAWGRSGLVRVSGMQFGAAANDPTDNFQLKGQSLAPLGGGTGGLGLGNSFWNSYTGSANYTVSPNRPVDRIEGLAYAPYYNGTNCTGADSEYSNPGGIGLTTGGPSGWTTGLIGAVDAYHAGGSTNIANAFAYMDWDIQQGLQNDSVTIGADNKTFTIGHNVFAPGNLHPVVFSILPGGTMFTGITAGATYYSVNGSDTGNPPGNSVFQVSASPTGSPVVTGISGGVNCVVASSTALTLANITPLYANTEAIAAEYDASRPGGMGPLTINCYEGAMGSTGLVNLCSAFALSLTGTTTAVINIGAGGSGTQISWTGHGFDNGASVGFNVSITDINSLVIPAYPINTGQTNNTPGGVIFLYVINAQPNSFDISYKPGGTPVNIASVGGGTQTAWGSNYCGASGESDRLSLLLKAYKQSSNFQATVKSQYDTQFTYSHTSTVVWFTLNGAANANPWTMYNGDVYASIRYRSYDAVAAYHN